MSTTTQDELLVRVRADISQYLAGMKEAGGATSSAGAQIRSEIEGVGAAAEGASGHLSGFSKVLREHVAEERGQIRMAGFLANQISEIGGASKSTAGDVAHLLSAFAFGGGFGIVVEAGRLIAKGFMEGGDEVKKFAADAGKHIDELREKVDGYLATLRGATEGEKLQHKEVGPLLREEFVLKQNLMEANHRAADAQEALNKATSAKVIGSDLAAVQASVDATTALVEERQKLLNIKQKEIAQARGLVGQVDTATAKEAREKALNEWNEYKQQAYLKDLEAAEKVQNEWNEYNQQSYLKDLENFRKHQLDVLKATEEAERKKFELSRHIAEERAKDAERVAKTEEKQAKATEQIWHHAATTLESTFSSSISQMLRGTMTADEAVKGMLLNLVDASIAAMVRLTVQWIATAAAGKAAAKVEAISTTQGHIAEAVAGAAASQAAIPIFGPGMAAAAAAEMLSNLEMMTTPLLSAARGFDIPAGLNPVTQLHEREMVLPAQYADVIRGMGSGGGGGGVHNHYWNAIDGDSVRRFVESDAFVRSFSGAQRRGRIR